MATATLEKPQMTESASLGQRVVASGLSFDEFVAAPQFHGRHVEWVEGEVIEKMSVSLPHALLTSFLRVSWSRC